MQERAGMPEGHLADAPLYKGLRTSGDRTR